MKHLMIALLSALILGHAGIARADFDEKEVARIAKDLQEGKTVLVADTIPKSAVQLVYIRLASESVQYMIDAKAQLCFARVVQAVPIPVPCKAVKKGYPLIAPLITWDD